MDLRVYTASLRVRRETWGLFDISFGRAVPLLPLGVGVAIFMGLFLLALRGLLPQSLNAFVTYAALGALVGWLADRPVMEGKPIHLWALSQVGYLVEPKVLFRLARPASRVEKLGVRIRQWRPEFSLEHEGRARWED